jgi:prepilin signal peptidase PulO-like enzyme (type II secretory pathway)
MAFVIIFLTGTAIASFIGSLAYRVPRGISILHPPSFCPACGNRIRACDLVPILSYVLLRGRCRECGGRISPANLLLEIGLPLVYVGVYLRCGTGMLFFTRTYLLTILVYVGLLDLQTGRIGLLDVVLVYLGGGAVLVFASLGLIPFGPLHYLGGAGAACTLLGAGFGITWLLKRRPPLGTGDLLLLPGACLCFGLPGAVRVLLISSAAGILAAVLLVRMKKAERGAALPLLPFFAAGVVIEIVSFSCYT